MAVHSQCAEGREPEQPVRSRAIVGVRGNMIDASDVIDFWFTKLRPEQWWRRDDALDREIERRYGSLHAKAAHVELFAWRDEPRGRLAEVIVLDQFSRNLFRDSPRAFACDPLALALAQEGIRGGADRALSETERGFFYMPFMHSESPLIHLDAERLFKTVSPFQYEYELRHKTIVDRFGRYPHRNAVLGRPSTTEEIEFLQQPGSSF